jgi:dTDP-4-dehydrorhamnose reductase
VASYRLSVYTFPMQRILIVGASSQVGAALAMRFRRKHLVTGTYDRHPAAIDGIARLKLSLRQDTPWEKLVGVLRPDTIFYCAAERDERLCQTKPLNALAVNAEIPAALAAVLENTPTKLVYFSTSKVFSGDRGDYTEDDPPDPSGHYGHGKVRAEEMLSETGRVFILRLGTLYGLGPVPDRSLLQRLLRDLWSGQPTPLIDDEFRSFQSLDWVAECCERLLEAPLQQAGLYHLPGPAKESHYSFALALGHALRHPCAHLQGLTGAAFSKLLPPHAPRGADTSLNGARFESVFNLRPDSTGKYLDRLAEQLRTGSF